MTVNFGNEIDGLHLPLVISSVIQPSVLRSERGRKWSQY